MMRNRLSDHLTRWKWWYAIPGFFALVLSSIVLIIPALYGNEDKEASGTSLGPIQLITMAILGLVFIALLARKWPTREDLAFRGGLGRRDLAIIGVGFVVSHAIFWALGRMNEGDPDQAAKYFKEFGLDGTVLTAAIAAITAVILAPVCEELLFRGAILRPIHDAISRPLGAVLGILASTFAFAMPHLGDLSVSTTTAYLVTGITFGLVYILTGSMVAAMVSHSLQSMVAFGQILHFGRGDTTVSPIVWIIVFGCPLWVYLIALGLDRVFPCDRVATASVGRLARRDIA